jgi:hypothetical protein
MIVIEYADYDEYKQKKVFPDLKAEINDANNKYALLLKFKYTSILAEQLYGGDIWNYYCKFDEEIKEP